MTVIGNGYDTAEYIRLCNLMSKINPLLHINFRPHPIERANAKAIAKGSDLNVDFDLNIYRTFKKSRVLIGEVSKSLYEAIGLVDHIFSIDSSRSCFFDPESPFRRIDDLAAFCENEFVTKIAETDLNCVNQISYWEDSWKENYNNFIHELT